MATAIPKISDEFHTLKDVSWYGSATLMTMGGFQSTWGKIYKYFPLKSGFLVSLFIFELGSLICGVAPTSVALIIGRAIAGVGAAGVGSGCFISKFTHTSIYCRSDLLLRNIRAPEGLVSFKLITCSHRHCMSTQTTGCLHGNNGHGVQSSLSHRSLDRWCFLR